MKSVSEIVQELQSMANPEYTQRMSHFGIASSHALGIKNADLKPYARQIGKNQALAEALWKEPIHEAKLLATLLAEPKKLSEEVAEKWIADLYSWDICDALGMKAFPKTSYGYEKAFEWTKRKSEFEKRAGFATMVGIILDKKVSDEEIESFFPIMEREAWDERNFVKKAVNWALRQAGKRDLTLNKKAIQCAIRVKEQNTKSARWIASDALRELKSEAVQERLKKKAAKKQNPLS